MKDPRSCESSRGDETGNFPTIAPLSEEEKDKMIREAMDEMENGEMPLTRIVGSFFMQVKG